MGCSKGGIEVTLNCRADVVGGNQPRTRRVSSEVPKQMEERFFMHNPESQRSGGPQETVRYMVQVVTGQLRPYFITRPLEE